MLHPFASCGIALRGILDPFRKDLLKHLIVIVLRSPDVHVKGQPARDAGCGFELLHQLEVIRTLEELFRKFLDRFPQCKAQCCLVERHSFGARFFNQSVDTREVQILDILESRAHAAVNGKLRCD